MDKTVTIDDIYSLIRKEDDRSDTLIDCLFIQNWFNSIFDFDPITNKPLPSTNDYLFSRINNIETVGSTFWWNDRIENIVRFTEKAVFSLFDTLHNKILSEHIITHSNRVKETDSTSIRWLSKKPGRTVRQKIADSGKLMGVFHVASIDTTENRLLKAFLIRMDNILYEKEQLATSFKFQIPEDTNNFIIQVHRWLKSEDASYIGTWNNSYPNNTLLNDKNYRKIWNAWCELQQINDYLEKDLSLIEHLKCLYYFWNRIAWLSIHPNYRLLQAPVFRNEDSLNIDSYFTNIAGWYIQNDQRESVFFELKQESKCISIIKNGYASLENIPDISYSHKRKDPELKIYAAECFAFDLTTIKPYFAPSDSKEGMLDSKLIYQTWQAKESQNKMIDVDCSNSRMISLKHALKTITIHDYFKEDVAVNDFNPSSAASVFADSIKRQLKASSYIYLLPDEFDDFSKMQIALRHQLNIKFSNISPLPRSIARIFQTYEKEGVEILQKKYFVVDKFDNYWIVTKVIPKKSDLLLKKYPDSDGIIFEHFPSTVIYRDSIESDGLFTLKDTKQLHGNFTMDEDHIAQLNGTLNFLEMDAKLAEFRRTQTEDFEYISVTPDDNLAIGAITYYNYQRKTPDVILWREHLPPLRLETSGQKLVLVDEATEGISPKKGEEKEIPVNARFEMPAGKDFYEFSLFKGDKKEKSKYYAYLINESFPLSKNIVCKLKLTFTYGDEHPYKLKFVPDFSQENPPFNYVLTRWEKESHQDHRKLPYPDFCKEYTWDDMTKFPKRDEDGTSDLIGYWLPREFDKLENYKLLRVRKKLSPRNIEQNDDAVFLDFMCQNGKNPICYIPGSENVQVGDWVACYLEQTNRGWQGKDPFVLRNDNSNKFTSFRKSLRFPMLTVWNNGRSLQDADCPNDFRLKTFSAIQNVLKIAENEKMPQAVLDEMFLFLSYLHKDTLSDFINVISAMFNDNNIDKYHRNISFVIGDGKLAWQKDLLTKTIALFFEGKKDQYAFAILAICLWRVKSLVFELEYSDVDIIIKKATEKIKNYLACTKDKFVYKKKNEIFTTDFDKQIVSVVEVILAILRLRETQDEKKLKLLSTEYNNEFKSLCKQLKKLSEKIKKDGIVFNSRINFDMQQYKNDKTAPLLFATTKYATGEIESNSIRVLSVNEDE